MKRTLTVMLLTMCCVVVIATLFATQHRPELGASSASSLSAPRYLADGGTPPPPWPMPSSITLADGGTPPPPWPQFPGGNQSLNV